MDAYTRTEETHESNFVIVGRRKNVNVPEEMLGGAALEINEDNWAPVLQHLQNNGVLFPAYAEDYWVWRKVRQRASKTHTHTHTIHTHTHIHTFVVTNLLYRISVLTGRRISRLS